MKAHNRFCSAFAMACLSVLVATHPGLSDAAENILRAKVVQVKDGDTIVVSPLEGGQFITCRLDSIDAPEMAKPGKAGQPYGKESTQQLKDLILSEEVEVTVTGRDRYRRSICLVGKDGVDINKTMVELGLAWVYRRYLKPYLAREYLSAEERARKDRVGLWADDNPVPPWAFRKGLLP